MSPKIVTGGKMWSLNLLLTTNIPQWKPGIMWSDKHTNNEEKRIEVWIASRELGSTNEIETKELLTTNTTIYTTAKVSLPYTTIVYETER